MMKNITFKISYHNGDATTGRLDMYDASVSFQGFAKALSITTHALLNDGEIRKKGNSIDGATLYINPSKKGSFEQFITLVVDNPEVVGVSVLANVFYDLIKWTWSKTLEVFYEPETPQVRKLQDRVEPFIGEMEEALEIPLEQAHRPIRNDEAMLIILNRPRLGEVMRMDIDTLHSVSLQTESEITRGIIGNVTRYNILSGFGRLFDDSLDQTISFKIQSSVLHDQKQLLTWSMHHAQNEQGEGKLLFEVKRVRSAKGVVRRYLVYDVKTINS